MIDDQQTMFLKQRCVREKTPAAEISDCIKSERLSSTHGRHGLEHAYKVGF